VVVWTLEENEQELNEGKNGEDHNSFYNYVVKNISAGVHFYYL